MKTHHAPQINPNFVNFDEGEILARNSTKIGDLVSRNSSS